MKEWCVDLEKYAQEHKTKYLVVMDNCPSHTCFLNKYFVSNNSYPYQIYEINNSLNIDTINSLKCEHIKFMLLPPNTTSTFQPLDAGIIRSFKSIYKNKYINMFCEELGIELSCEMKEPIQRTFNIRLNEKKERNQLFLLENVLVELFNHGIYWELHVQNFVS